MGLLSLASYFFSVNVSNVTLIFYRQEKEADDIQLVAARAVNTSTSAYELARDAIKQQQNIRYCEHVSLLCLETVLFIIHSFCSLFYDRSVASSKASSPQGAI
jgi:hypothetical protein